MLFIFIVSDAALEFTNGTLQRNKGIYKKNNSLSPPFSIIYVTYLHLCLFAIYLYNKVKIQRALNTSKDKVRLDKVKIV